MNRIALICSIAAAIFAFSASSRLLAQDGGDDAARTVEKLSDEEAAKLKAEDYAKTEAVGESDLGALGLAAGCSSGQGRCTSGKCYVCCNGSWYRLVDRNSNHYSCSAGRGKNYECNGATWKATC